MTHKLPYDKAYLLDCINDETARASRNKPPTTWSICWTVLMMKQREQAETTLQCAGVRNGNIHHLRPLTSD